MIKKEFKHPILSRLNKILDRIDFLIISQNFKTKLGPNYNMISNNQFIELFNISSGTATNWREKEVLPYIKIEEKIYYKLSDVKKLIDKNISKKKR